MILLLFGCDCSGLSGHRLNSENNNYDSEYHTHEGLDSHVVRRPHLFPVIVVRSAFPCHRTALLGA